MPKISQEEYQQRLDRLTEIFSDIVSHADVQATQRCPYRDARDRCTAAFSCGNQIPAADKGEPATCGHDGTFDYSDAWEDDPAAEERARKKLRGIRQSAAARREGGALLTGPGTVSHDGKTQPLAIGMTLFDCADELAVEVPTSCMRNGRCHECVVEVTGGKDALCARTEAESFLRPPHRLACQAVVERDDIDVTFTPLRRRPRILVRAHVDAAGAPETLDPLVTRRGADVLYDGHVVDRYRGHMLGLAVDLGTTTVVLDFVDLETGKSVHSAAFENPQAFGGSDIMHRISYDRDDKAGELQKAAASAISRAIVDGCARLGLGRESIYEIVVAANPTMRDILFKLDVQGIGQKPYKSSIEHAFLAGERANTALTALARRLGLRANREARVYGLPLIASHVGGDAAAALVALEQGFADAETVMLVDMGTNTEVVLKHRGRLLAASCPAGPAFEGGLVRYGMPACDGAIETVRFGADGETLYETIGGAAPVGLCGSGLIDLLAELRRGECAYRQRRLRRRPKADGNDSSAGARHHLLEGRRQQSRPGQGRQLLRPVDRHARARGRSRQGRAALSRGRLRQLRERPERHGHRPAGAGAGGARHQGRQRGGARRARDPALGHPAPGAGTRGPGHRAYRARDHAGLLRPLRRRLPVQADAIALRASRDRRMTAAPTPAPSLTVIGENIHCTRVALRKGKRIAERDGAEAILYRTADGEERALPVTEAAKRTKDYEEGRVKHVQVAIETAMETAASDPPSDPAEGLRYIEALVRHQERAGAAFLDLNVDEISPRLGVQTGAMAWLAATVQGLTDLPISVDSSSVDVIRAGLKAIAPAQARPMLNSASLERLEALDLARAHDCRAVVTAAGERGMPDGSEARVANATRMVEAALARGFTPGDLYIDPLVFPISVDSGFGRHCLDAIRALRARFGGDIHITGGMSNVSFGLPARKLLNDIFVLLAIEAGADGGILDPVASPAEAILAIDREDPRYRLAEDVMLGRDEHCMAYIRAWRKGQLAAA